MKAPDKIYIAETPNKLIEIWSEELIESKSYITEHEYIRKDLVVDAIKLAYGKVSMNPFDCSEAFEELLNKVGYEIH